MMDEESPKKTSCVYERRLTDLEKLQRRMDVLVARLSTIEQRNNSLTKSEKANTEEIQRLKKSLEKEAAKNRKMSEKLASYEEYELLESIIS